MALIKTHAFVGSAFPSGDKDLVIHLLAREFGRLSLFIRGGQVSKSGRTATLQPLAEIECTAYLREGRDLATLSEAALLDPHIPLRDDLARLALASFILDVALETSLPAEPIPEVYDHASAAFAALESAEESPPLTAAAHGLLRLLALNGVEPAIDESLLTGEWKRARGTTTRGAGTPAEAGGSSRKPGAFLLLLAEGLIVAAPGEPGSRHDHLPPTRATGRTQRVVGSSRRTDQKTQASQPGEDQKGHRRPSVTRRDADESRPRAPVGLPRAVPLPPAAVRAVYDHQRTPTDRLPDLPAIDPSAAADLLRALAALATYHLDIRPRSRRFLETVLPKP